LNYVRVGLDVKLAGEKSHAGRMFGNPPTAFILHSQEYNSGFKKKKERSMGVAKEEKKKMESKVSRNTETQKAIWKLHRIVWQRRKKGKGKRTHRQTARRPSGWSPALRTERRYVDLKRLTKRHKSRVEFGRALWIALSLRGKKSLREKNVP